MSGSRTKWLRREYAKKHGVIPKKSLFRVIKRHYNLTKEVL